MEGVDLKQLLPPPVGSLTVPTKNLRKPPPEVNLRPVKK